MKFSAKPYSSIDLSTLLQSNKGTIGRMIIKMISQSQLSKQDRRKFIPFVNQRNHMGQIIKTRQKDRQVHKSIDVFENLKKTTKQYFFDKKYQKMKQKLERYKFSLQPKQPDYDFQVNQCFRALQRRNSLKRKTCLSADLNGNNLFFVDLNQKLNKNITILKQQMQNNKKPQIQSQKNYLTKHKNTQSNNQSQLKAFNTTDSSFYSNVQNSSTQYKILARQNSLSKLSRKLNSNQKRYVSSINRQIFKEIGPQSQRMADFTTCGLKYKHLVKTQIKDPWKKWYIDTKLEIFPGQVVKIKKLQKSIYD